MGMGVGKGWMTQLVCELLFVMDCGGACGVSSLC